MPQLASVSTALGLAVLLLASSGQAQNLQLELDSSSGGRNGAINVQFGLLAGKESLALQWELTFPESIRIDPRAGIGEAAGKAGKTIRCEVLPNRAGAIQACRCILAGGTDAIPAGTISKINYSAVRSARPGRYELQLKKAFAVTNDMKKILLKDTRVDVILSK